MNIHPYARVFPQMSAEEYEELRDSIRENGLRHDITLHENMVVDGRHRQKACDELGIPPRYSQWDGKGSLVQYVIDCNLRRRHLTTNQLSMLGARLMEAFKDEAKQRSTANLTQFPDVQKSGPRQNVLNGRSSHLAAEAVETSHFSIEKAQTVIDRDHSALTAAVEANQVAVHNAADLAKLADAELTAVIAKGPEAMLEKAKELRSEKKAATAGRSPRKPIAACGLASVRKWLDGHIDELAKSREDFAGVRFEEAQAIRAALCE